MKGNRILAHNGPRKRHAMVAPGHRIDDFRNMEKRDIALWVGHGIEGRRRRGQLIGRQGGSGIIGHRSVGGASDHGGGKDAGCT